MSPVLVFVHGWGFDAEFWRPVARRLPDFRSEALNLGFRGEAYQPVIRNPLVIGHSMGFAWALAHLPGPWAGAMAINAFTRFTRSSDFIEGVAPRMTGRMIERFAEDPQTVTADFLRRCGVGTPDLDGLDFPALGRSLDWLAGCDERPAFARLSCPIFAIAGTRDAIVPELMAKATFAGQQIEFLEGGGHLLPATHPEWVASRIRLLVAGL